MGHEARVERFARVFRQLPTATWRDIRGLGEHVVGRSTTSGGKRYVYVVNRFMGGEASRLASRQWDDAHRRLAIL